ncbi:MAG: hypothetical protein ACREH4_12845 [Vitreimonas sp.]
MRIFVCAVALALTLASPAGAQQYALEQAAAAELQNMCANDGSQLWRVSLCGPLIVVDPATRSAWASQADSGGVLRANGGGGWIGALPQGVPLANSAVTWSGVRWIMVMSPLPRDATERRVLLAHEAWHRIQEQIALAGRSSDAPHLETERGRYFLRLEMRALATALRSRASARRHAAEDALLFRAARLAEFSSAAGAEAALDRNEGLASYTGVRLGAEQPDIYAARTLDQYDLQQAYVRSYAYATGPAYGVLLDDYAEDWRRNLGNFAPADLLAGATPPPRLRPRSVRRAAERYGGADIAVQERDRAIAQRTRIAELRQRYATGPRLELPLRQMQFEFDPTRVTSVEGLGTFYSRLTLRDLWGELVAADGALVDTASTQATAAAPDAGGLSGPGWRLRLNPGYAVSGPDGSGVRRVVPLAQQ